MSDSGILAPVRILEMKVQRASIDVSDTPAESMVQAIDVSFDTDEPIEDEEQGIFSLPMFLGVNVSVANADDGRDVRASASTRVLAIVAMDLPLARSQGMDRAFQYLRLNGVSMAYAHARSCIMTMTSMSPMGSLIIPPVVPNSVINAHDELAHSQEGDARDASDSLSGTSPEGGGGPGDDA